MILLKSSQRPYNLMPLKSKRAETGHLYQPITFSDESVKEFQGTYGAACPSPPVSSLLWCLGIAPLQNPHGIITCGPDPSNKAK